MPILGTAAVIAACLALLVLMFRWLNRVYAKEEARWENLGGGTVASAVVSLVPYSTAYGDLGYPTHPATQTVITFDDGRNVAIIGDFGKACAQGARISILINGLGRFRVEPYEG